MVSFNMKKVASAAATGRSSTASHFVEGHEKLTAGVAADEFYGIPLSADITHAETETLVYLAVLILLILVKPAIKPLQQNTALSLAFWAAILAFAYAIKEVTFYPLVSVIILTRTTYPYLVVISHCIVANSSYRKEKEVHGPLHYFVSFALGFFCVGFGGSIVSDVLMGLPVTALAHARIVPCWVLGWFLVWFSPNDIFYKLLNDKNSFVSYFFNACEAMDAVTTPMGRASRSARELRNKAVAPIMAGVFAGAGGAMIRYCERTLIWKGGEDIAKSSRDALEAGAWKNFWYSLLWWYVAIYKCENGDYENEMELNHCQEYNGANWWRFTIVAWHVIWCFGCDLGLLSGHPFLTVTKMLQKIGGSVARTMNYGPNYQYLNGEAKREKSD
jgi:TRIC channel